MMKPRAQMKNTHLHLLENNEPISAYANRPRLKQILINFLFDGMQYTPIGGKVTIKWEKFSPTGLESALRIQALAFCWRKSISYSSLTIAWDWKREWVLGSR